MSVIEALRECARLIIPQPWTPCHPPNHNHFQSGTLIASNVARLNPNSKTLIIVNHSSGLTVGASPNPTSPQRGGLWSRKGAEPGPSNAFFALPPNPPTLHHHPQWHSPGTGDCGVKCWIRLVKLNSASSSLRLVNGAKPERSDSFRRYQLIRRAQTRVNKEVRLDE